MNFATRLKMLRKEKKMTQDELANTLNVERPTVTRWETGKNLANQDIMEKLCDLFNVSMDFLVGRSDIKNPESTNIENENKNVITIYGRGSGTKTAELTDKQYQAVLAIVESFADNPDDPFKK